MRRGLFFLLCAALLLSFFMMCADIPGGDDVPDDLEMSFTVSKLNDAVNAYCFYPIELTVKFGRNNVRYVDSMFLITSDSPRALVYKLDLGTLAQTFTYSDTGTHRAALRVYERAGGGAFYDSVFTVRTAISYGVGPVEARVEKSGTRVELRAGGYKYNGVDWHWDLSGVGLGVIRASGDTAVLVDRDLSGAIEVSQINSAGVRSVPVSVPFSTALPRLSPVPFTVSQVSALLNSYCFFPVTFTANPRPDDRVYIDSVQLFVGGNTMEAPLRLGPENNYTAVFDFADTGSHICLMRVFDGTGADGAPPYWDTQFAVWVGANFGVDGLESYPVSDTGGVVTLRARGDRHSGVFWDWDLSKFGGGRVRSLSDTVSVYLSGPVNSDTVYLSQTRVDTVNGVVRERTAPRRAFVLNTRIAAYRLTIRNARDADLVTYLLGDPAPVVRSADITSGEDVAIGYLFGEGCYWASYHSDGSETAVSMCVVDSVFVNGVRLSSFGIVNLRAVREDTEVVYHARILPISKTWWPTGLIWEVRCSDYFGVVLYQLNKDMRSGRIRYEGYTNSDFPEATKVGGTFELSGDWLKKGGHTVYYDNNTYGVWGNAEVVKYGVKEVHIEFEDSLGQRTTDIVPYFGLSYPLRPYSGWDLMDGPGYQGIINSVCLATHNDIYYGLPTPVRPLFPAWYYLSDWGDRR